MLNAEGFETGIEPSAIAAIETMIADTSAYKTTG